MYNVCNQIFIIIKIIKINTIENCCMVVGIEYARYETNFKSKIQPKKIQTQ